MWYGLKYVVDIVAPRPMWRVARAMIASTGIGSSRPIWPPRPSIVSKPPL